MNYHPGDTYCVDESLTPRVRTIFRTPQRAAAQPAPTPTQAPSTGASTEPQALGWHDLICAILESLFPFPDAYTVVRQLLDVFEAKLSSPSDQDPRRGPPASSLSHP